MTKPWEHALTFGDHISASTFSIFHVLRLNQASLSRIFGKHAKRTWTTVHEVD